MVFRGSTEKQSLANEPAGLEVVQPPAYLERAQQDSEGLQAWDMKGGSDGLQSTYPEVYKRPYAAKDSDLEPVNASPHASSPLNSLKRNRRKWLLGLAVLAVIVVLAAVLGGVFGSRATSKSSNASTSPPSTSSPPTSSSSSTTTAANTRTKSTTGTWNGTGISAWTDIGGVNGNLCFQDYTSAIICATFALDNSTNTLSLTGVPSSLAVTAGNNTALRTVTWMANIPWTYQTFYVDSTGHWADVSQTALNGPLTVGNLSKLHVEAPTDFRPGVTIAGGSIDSPEKGHTGGRFIAGARDGHVYQYSYDETVGTWYPNSTHAFLDASATGPVAVIDMSNPDGSLWRNLVLSDQNGNLKYYAQQDGGDSTGWPNGGQWSIAKDIGQQASVNSSVVSIVDWEGDGDGYIWFPQASSGNIETQHTNYNRSAPENSKNDGFLDVADAGGKRLPMMPGSDMALTVAHMSNPTGGLELRWNLVFYQDEGTSIAYAVLADDAQKILSSGHIAYQDGSWKLTS